MMFIKDLQPRKHIRLRYYDYKMNGYYFVTICCEGRQCLFGDIENGVMHLNEAGNMINAKCQELPILYPEISLDCHVVMPNHIHAIITILPRQRSAQDSLFDIMRKLKTYTTHCYIKGVHELGWLPFEKRLWQRGYYEHIIRNDNALEKIRTYIGNNPMQWELDKENPY